VISAPAEAQANEQAERATAATLETAPVEAPVVEATTPVEAPASPEIEVAPVRGAACG
jgi:ribonuclease E